MTTGPEARRCRYCGVEIRLYDFGDGPEWLHIKTNTAAGRAGPYKYCETSTVATPPETVGEWASRVFGQLQGKEKT